jgi:hypothetical protein
LIIIKMGSCEERRLPSPAVPLAAFRFALPRDLPGCNLIG